ncbi:MAG TPA: hypothetical protein VEB21_08210 [Terriglobales bacterium]|nr:hypothetical protein [Terriglobales bacterium]
MKVWQAQRMSLVVALLVIASGCSASRVSRTPTIGDYDYCVVHEEDAHGYGEQVRSILSQSFVVLDEQDPRLREAAVRHRTCAVSLRWRRGFWYTPVWAEVSDYDSGEVVLRTEVRGPGLWSGVPAAVPLAIQDIVAARVSAGPLYIDTQRQPTFEEAPLGSGAPRTAVETLPAARPKAERLRELRELYDDGLISEREYEEERSYIIRE